MPVPFQLPRPLGASKAENVDAVEGPFVDHGIVEVIGGDTGAYSRGECRPFGLNLGDVVALIEWELETENGGAWGESGVDSLGRRNVVEGPGVVD